MSVRLGTLLELCLRKRVVWTRTLPLPRHGPRRPPGCGMSQSRQRLPSSHSDYTVLSAARASARFHHAASHSSAHRRPFYGRTPSLRTSTPPSHPGFHEAIIMSAARPCYTNLQHLLAGVTHLRAAQKRPKTRQRRSGPAIPSGGDLWADREQPAATLQGLLSRQVPRLLAAAATEPSRLSSRPLAQRGLHSAMEGTRQLHILITTT